MIDDRMVCRTGKYKPSLSTNKAYSTFGPKKQANSILFIVYKYAPGKAYMNAEIKAAFIWKPSVREKAEMFDDFVIIRRMCDHGYAHCLSEDLVSSWEQRPKVRVKRKVISLHPQKETELNSCLRSRKS